jgi:hypothetical protein
MSCLFPPELTDRDLLAYVDGEAAGSVATHVAGCPYCRERAHGLARAQGRLAARLYRLTCPTPAELGEYYLAMLSRERSAWLAQHLLECPHCAREVAQLQGYLDELDTDVEPGVLERLRVLVARLVRGSAVGGGPHTPVLAPAYGGLRGAPGETATYEAEGVRITLQVQEGAAEQSRTLLGLVTGIALSGLEARLWAGSELVGRTLVDELGNFALVAASPGRYALSLCSSQSEVRIPDLEF